MENLLTTGTKIVLTKTKIKEGKTSAFKVGEKRSGTLSDDCKERGSVHFNERSGMSMTSNIISIKKDSEKIVLETWTSFYDVRIVTNNADKEFQKWLYY